MKFLRILVTILTGTMIAGLVILITLLVIRFPESAPPLPDAINLPDGTEAAAFTVGGDWYAVVTEDDRILVFDRADGTLRRTIDLQ